ncbi:hypothetical protein CC78DRAFT_553004 [Lojkania enalia]|uniref:Vacuolar ATPase assembly protein VMA22 n=1 Tax=Lojkania enalia TaxID=147567 RepID=A0A9P4KB30_9PLEO|nr:hypothetical protein CC78DRAFT_553004 [Didymosphaeria enalia]
MEAPSKNALISQLDSLLERYLNTLNQYQKAQQQLTSNLSSGYLSLAQANFNNQSHSRYGQDYYDERMQAFRKVKGSAVAFRIPAPKLDPSSASGPASSPPNSSGKPTEENNSEVSATSSESENEDESVNNAPSGESSTCSDPLRWFGILVPSALRQAQSSFVSAIEGPIPQLATIVREMRRQESEISRLRKQIKKL